MFKSPVLDWRGSSLFIYFYFFSLDDFIVKGKRKLTLDSSIRWPSVSSGCSSWFWSRFCSSASAAAPSLTRTPPGSPARPAPPPRSPRRSPDGWTGSSWRRWRGTSWPGCSSGTGPTSRTRFRRLPWWRRSGSCTRGSCARTAGWRSPTWTDSRWDPRFWRKVRRSSVSQRKVRVWVCVCDFFLLLLIRVNQSERSFNLKMFVVSETKRITDYNPKQIQLPDSKTAFCSSPREDRFWPLTGPALYLRRVLDPDPDQDQRIPNSCCCFYLVLGSCLFLRACCVKVPLVCQNTVRSGSSEVLNQCVVRSVSSIRCLCFYFLEHVQVP